MAPLSRRRVRIKMMMMRGSQFEKLLSKRELFLLTFLQDQTLSFHWG